MARKSRVGGPRMGAGRPPGTGPGPSPDARRNRVAVLLSDTELATLRRLAAKNGLPVGTQLYEICKRSLRRRK